MYKRAGRAADAARLSATAGDLQGAAAIVEQSTDPVAAEWLARHLESLGDPASALRFRRMAAPKRATPIASHGLGGGFTVPPAVLGLLSHARQLMPPGGVPARAPPSAATAGTTTRPRGTPEAMPSSGAHDEATVHAEVLALAAAGRCGDALSLCEARGVHITAQIGEALTPPKPGAGAPRDESERRAALLVRIAEACTRQRSFHLACKKYTQAGEKLRAVHALIEAGDTEKVAFYAGAAKSAAVAIAGGDYLMVRVSRSQHHSTGLVHL